MKLLYVWIKEYRNIKELGFNFSSEFEIKLNNNKIEVKKRPDYVKNFFGACITEVTAIIGKNGTGKSNIIDFICTSLIKGKRNTISNARYLYIFEEDGELYYYNKLKNSIIDLQFINQDTFETLKVIQLNETSQNWDCIFYSNIADGRKLQFAGNTVINLSYEENLKNQANKIKYLSYIHNKIKDPKGNYITALEEQIDFKNISFRLSFDNQTSNNNINIDLIKDRYKTAYSAKDTVNKFSYFMTAALLEFLFKYYTNGNFISNAFKKLIDDIETTQTTDGKVAEKIATLKEKVSITLKECIIENSPSLPMNINDFAALIDLLSKLQNREYDESKYLSEYSDKYFQIKFSEGLLQLLMEYSSIFNYTEMILHDWNKLSSGMKAYLNLFSNLYSHINDIEKQNILICIDEGDLYFHPEMQRNFLNDILEFLCFQFKDKNVQVILTSHSPFLVSDLPNENLILVKIAKEDSSLSIEKGDYKTPSFASNIYQLFNNQFFLENGTMGEFAKKKLNELLLIIKKDTIPNEDIIIYQKISGKIGDEVIRLKMEELLIAQTSKINNTGNEFLKSWYFQKYKELGGVL